MKFKLQQAKSFFKSDKEKKDLEKLGFTFEERDFNDYKWYCTNSHSKNEIEIKSLEELIDFTKKWGQIVFNEDGITIYNDYME